MLEWKHHNIARENKTENKVCLLGTTLKEKNFRSIVFSLRVVLFLNGLHDKKLTACHKRKCLPSQILLAMSLYPKDDSETDVTE